MESPVDEGGGSFGGDFSGGLFSFAMLTVEVPRGCSGIKRGNGKKTATKS